jgi:hypothetical protein
MRGCAERPRGGDPAEHGPERHQPEVGRPSAHACGWRLAPRGGDLDEGQEKERSAEDRQRIANSSLSHGGSGWLLVRYLKPLQ